MEPSEAQLWRERIITLNAEAEDAKRLWESAAKKAKAAKENWEGCVLTLQAAIKGSAEECPLFDRPAPEPATTPEPLFEQHDPSLAPLAPDPDPAVAAQAEAEVLPPADPDGWKTVSVAKLAEFGLTDKLIDKLNQADLFNLGQLAAWTAEHPLTDLKGIGAASSGKIEDACLKYWEANRIAPPATPYPVVPDIDPAPAPSSEPAAEVAASPDPAPAPAPADPDTPGWHALGIPTLRVPGKLHGKLLDAGIKTLGDLVQAARHWATPELATELDLSPDDVNACLAALDAIKAEAPDPAAD